MWSFRPLTRADFPQLQRWLRQPHVARWWAHETSDEAIEADFGAAADGTDPGEVFIATRDGVPLGLIQRYFVASFPPYVSELEQLLPVPPGAISIDYLVGEPTACGRGLGSAMIAAFVERTWRDWPAAASLLVPVHAQNPASWRALERAGLRRVAAGPLPPDNPADSDAHVVYAMERPG
jgi:aminoglycoside 6'-N-acetyltransferase